MDTTFTVKEAYAAMYVYLQDRYDRGPSDEFGAMLGSMNLLPDGNTADAAVWHDWLRAVEKVKAADIDLGL